MTTSFDNCGICTLRNISKLPVVWCSDCDEGLCQDCREHHSFLKATRNHNIIPIAEYQKLPSFIANIKLHCIEHDEKYLLFCKKHNQLLCGKCVISVIHKDCKEIFSVEDVVQNAKTSVAFTEIESSLKELQENVGLILEDRQKNLSSISNSKEKIESEILALRKQIDYHLDKMQDHFLAELNTTVENSSKQMHSFIASLNKNQIEINECTKDVENIKKHATGMQTFLGISHLERIINKTEKELQTWIKGDSFVHTVVSCQLNTSLQNISKEINTFGKTIVDIQPCELSLQKKKEGQAQSMKVNVEPKIPVEHISLELKTKISTTAFNVSGCGIFPNGNFVVSNFDPSYLLFFTSQGNIDKKITNVMPNIYDVACIDNETVAIISYTERNIKLLSAKSGKVFSSIETSFSSRGLTYSEGKFIVCPDKGQLQEVSLVDDRTNVIGNNLVSTYVASSGNNLFSKKRATNTIVCHNKIGEILWTLTNETVLTGPSGITADEHGNIFVVGCKSKNVVAIASGGSTHKILLSE
ncbi:tripartite motif-containing protein 5-like isoform X2 [Mytilus californianus]|uniref:tripartite motif-containing protein 5-like isoform X2 n=1 Tax=Mytilus californianus TaxID=6549 RepID=UPI002245154F|nr:tripartite motif-containing protein 5-like isoform X2 [Mytilus californianus]XP_052067494.1 tripartite motif-containing protein 5-like isoform X2 [Mytilus californianus]XP_052067495.1 tripartite motif-containing protein 5-like isoform X2 [Mytilus californianus]